jgi:hypothetical protein
LLLSPPYWFRRDRREAFVCVGYILSSARYFAEHDFGKFHKMGNMNEKSQKISNSMQ